MSCYRYRSKSGKVAGLGTVCVLASVLLSGCVPMVRGLYEAVSRQRERRAPQAIADPELLKVETAEQSIVAALKPVKSGPGLVVCEPVATGAATAQNNFGTGCARWLQFAIGGQGELGKTPLWTSVDDARRILKKNDLRLTTPEAAALAKHLGVTHVATGNLSGSRDQLVLTYQLLTVPHLKPVGSAITLQGSSAQIAERLPQAARRLVQTLGITKPQVPEKTLALANELKTIGAIPWEVRNPLPDARRQELLALAPRVPLAGMVYVHRGAYKDDPAWPRVARTLLKQAPQNAAVWGDISWDGAEFLVPREEQLEGLRRRYPHNYLLATARNRILRDGPNLKQARQMAELAVRCSPRNPRAWLSLASTISNQAQQIRLARYSTDMTASESQAVHALYPQCYEAAQQAAQIDPQYGAAWAEVAVAGTFAGETAAADTALWKSLQLDPTNGDAIYWGLQMYQPKWYGDRQKLLKVVQAAQAHPEVYMRSAQDIIWALRASGLRSQSAQVLPRAIQILEQRVQRDGEDAAAYKSLATLLSNNEQYQEAVPHFETWMRLEPKNSVPVHNLANMYLNHLKDVDKAEVLFQKAMQMAPENPGAPGALGAIYKISRWTMPKLRRCIESRCGAIQIMPMLWLVSPTFISSSRAILKKPISSSDRPLQPNPIMAAPTPTMPGFFNIRARRAKLSSRDAKRSL